MYDLVKSMHSESMCAVKTREKQTELFTQGRGVCQGCNLSPTLFNVYINELAVELDQCAAPGLSLLDREVKSLFYADDLVLLSLTEQGLQQQLDIEEKYCQRWALAVNMKKTNVMIFQKHPRCQGNKPQFTINNHITEHNMSYTYLGISIAASGSFDVAVNVLKKRLKEPYMQSRENFIISKFQSKSVSKYLIVSSSPLRSTAVKSWVHSVIRAIPTGTNIQQNLYMQNSADSF